MSEKYIFLSDNKKIKNPIYEKNRCNIFSYQGKLDNIDFEYQTNNFELISESLKPFNIYFDHIWYGKFTNSSEKTKTHFLVKSADNLVYWLKYEGMAPGSGQNKIFINGNEFKTTYWLELSHLDRQEVIDNSYTV